MTLGHHDGYQGRSGGAGQHVRRRGEGDAEVDYDRGKRALGVQQTQGQQGQKGGGVGKGHKPLAVDPVGQGSTPQQRGNLDHQLHHADEANQHG